MDRRRHTAIATLFAADDVAPGSTISLPDAAAQHARVRRMEPGDAVRLTNGRGTLGEGTVERLTKNVATVAIERVDAVARPPHLRLFVPIADRERMLWLAEKSAEIGVTIWQPILFRRSASVSPRGEGDKFRDKVRARMISALEQSGGAWLPEIGSELTLADALVRATEASVERFLFERGGSPLLAHEPRAADALIGPEGGLDDEERTSIVEGHHWVPVSLGDTTLRFETAGVVAAGMLRALLPTA